MTDPLLGAPVAGALLDDLSARVLRGTSAGRPRPSLVSVHRAGVSPFAVYLKQQSKTAERVGVGFRSIELPSDLSAAALRATLADLQADASVHAVLLEHPLPEELDFLGAVSALAPAKDVDGVSPESLGRLVSRRPVHVPAVARAALRIVHHYGIPLEGRRVAVVGRSPTVGLPLATLLLARGAGADATVTVAHSRTPHLADALAGAEVVFSCAGHVGLLNRGNVPRGAAVIDIGLSTVPDASRPSGQRMAGDADGASLDGWASAITPVPGGVGPVTSACLMENAVRAWELQTQGAP